MELKHIVIKYWDAADAIAAFACVHMVAFLFSLLSKDASRVIATAPWLTRGLVVAFWIIYSGGICLCVHIGLKLVAKDDAVLRSAWSYALWGRLGAVLIFTSIVLLALARKPIKDDWTT